jgi:fibronectin type 3 domain-containing protein
MSFSSLNFLRAIAVVVILVGTLGLVGCKSTKHSVTLSWEPAVPAENVPIKGYNVYRAEKSGGPYVLIASAVPVPAYKDWDVSSHKTLYYVVTTVDEAGRESKYSKEIKASVP